MAKKILLVLIILLWLPIISFADTVYLKKGGTIKGKILQKESYYVIVQDGTIPKKIYTYEIDHIDSDVTLQSKLGDLNNINDKPQLIKLLLEVNGTKAGIEKNFESVLSQAQGDRKEKLKSILDIDKIMDLFVPVYDKYFDGKDLKALIKFYQTTTGQKLVDSSQFILQETVQATILYFKDKATELNQPRQ